MQNYLVQQSLFLFRTKYLNNIYQYFNKQWLSLLGMQIGKGVILSSQLHVTWPHQISIGNNCILEHNINFKFSGVWSKGPSIQISHDVFVGSGCEFNIQKNIKIGAYCNIASGCKFIDHDHGIKAGELIGPQIGKEGEIILGKDVWLGFNVLVLKGVTIGDGAVIAAGAVVTKSILTNEIWAGVPARKIGERK